MPRTVTTTPPDRHATSQPRTSRRSPRISRARTPNQTSPDAHQTSPAAQTGTPGIVMAPRGRLVLALAFTIPDDKISGIDVIADPARLAQLDLAVLDD